MGTKRWKMRRKIIFCFGVLNTDLMFDSLWNLCPNIEALGIKELTYVKLGICPTNCFIVFIIWSLIALLLVYVIREMVWNEFLYFSNMGMKPEKALGNLKLILSFKAFKDSYANR